MMMIPLLIITMMSLPVMASNTSDMNRPQLGGLLGQGLGLGPGLVNFTFFFFPAGRNVSGGFCKIFDGRAKGKQVS